MSSGSPVPGWYPDPYDQNQLRYWDGRAWSEATTPATGGQSVPPASGPAGGDTWSSGPSGETPAYGAPAYGAPAYGAPAYGAPAYGAPAYGAPAADVGHGGGHGGLVPQAAGSGLGDVGDWLKTSFTVLFQRIVPVSILLFLLPAVAYSLVGIAGWLSVSELRFDALRTDSPQVSGFRPALLVLAGLFYVGLLLVSVVTWLAAGHQLYFGHTGQPRSLGASLAVAFRRLPRTLLWLVLLSLASIVAFGLLLGMPAAIAVATDTPAPLILWLLTMPLALALAVWIGVRLFHLSVSLVLAPGGANPVRASYQLTRGRWLATFGRALLLFAILFGLNLVSQTFFSVVFQVASFAALDLDPVTGEPRIDGRSIDDVDAIVVGDLVPGIPLILLLGVIYALSQAVMNGVWLAGAAGLYGRAGGPVDERL